MKNVLTFSLSIRTVLLAVASVVLLLMIIPQSLFAAVTVYQTQSKRDFLTKVYADQMANGGVNQETAAHGYPQYQVSQVSPTGQRICYLYDPSAYPVTWSLGGFDSPGNNRMAIWNPAQNRWTSGSANSFGNKRYNYITCNTDAKADASLTSGGASEVTINRGESVPLTWYSQYGSVRKATCTAANFSTTVTVPAYTETTPVPNCTIAGFDLLSLVGFDCDGFLFNRISVPASEIAQPFSGTTTVSPTQTTTYTYSCANANGTETAKVKVNVVQPEQEPIAVSCSPSASSGVINEPITWSTTVTGHGGPFTYNWIGSDGLIGATASVIKSYANVGTKTARVTVTFAPTGTDPSTPTTPTTPSCLPAGSEIPAGHINNEGPALQIIDWPQCCSGRGRMICIQNEPCEATCFARPGAVTETTVTTGWQWNRVCTGTPTGSSASDIQDGGTWNNMRNYLTRGGTDFSPAVPGFGANPSNYCVQGEIRQDCPRSGGGTCFFYLQWDLYEGSGTAPSGSWGPDQVCNQAQGGFCAQNSGGAKTWAPTVTTIEPPIVPDQGFSITTDCNGMICTDRVCSTGGGPGGDTPGSPGNPGNPGNPGTPGTPTWGVTINLPGQCAVGPMCVGASIHNQALDCSKEFVRACPFGCISGQCVAPQPEIELSVTPPGVRRGESCTLHVEARHVSSCSVSGTGISEELAVNPNGMVAPRTFRTPGIESTTEYTVTCTSPRGTVSKSAQCVFLPVFREQ